MKIENWKLEIIKHPHHAFLIKGDPALADEVFVTFGIDDAHELSRRQALRPAEGEKQIIIIGTYGMTEPAQNALLKTLEEPAVDSAVAIIMPYPDDLLPTLRSRLHILEDNVPAISREAGGINIVEFMAMTPYARLGYINQKFLSIVDDDEETHARAKYDACGIVTEIQRYLATDGEYKRDSGALVLFNMLNSAQSYLRDTSPNIKLILESVALNLPTIARPAKL